MRKSSSPSAVVNGLSFAFDRRSLSLISLTGGRGIRLDNGPAGAPAWNLRAVDAEGRRADLDGTRAKRRALRRLSDGIVLTWSGVADPARAAGPFDVTVSIRAVRGRPGLTAWRIRVENRSKHWTLWTVTFPVLSGLIPAGRGDRDRLFYPHGWGMEHVGLDKMPALHRRYPRGWDYSMQFLGYSRGSETLYCGAHDPRLTTKEFHFQVENGRPKVSLTLFPENMSRTGNGFDMNFDALIGVVPGNWYDAAGLYGDWARRQPWVTTRPAGASRESRWDREIHAWQVLQFPDKPAGDWAAQMERLAGTLGAGFGVHLYNWHRIPFDVSYPDYFPERKGLKAFVARMKRAGIVTMPYINGRLWDANSKSWGPCGAEKAVVRHSAERVNPRRLFQPVEEYGSGAKLSPMCPTTAIWRNKVEDLCRRIVGELGCDGVYIDQVGAERSELCFNPTHRHPLGGGGYWLQGYRRIAAAARRAAGPRALLTTESNWEGCIADYDALLSWIWFDNHDIPLFPAVYSGVSQSFGTQFSVADIEENGGLQFCRKMARLFVWGAQLGWGDLTLLLQPSQTSLLRFFTTLCLLRQEHVTTFASGRMARPPIVAAGNRDVLCSVWEDPVRGGHILFAANPTRRLAAVRLRIADHGSLRISLKPLTADALRLA